MGNSWDATLLMAAAYLGCKEAAFYLLENGADINFTTLSGKNAENVAGKWEYKPTPNMNQLLVDKNLEVLETKARLHREFLEDTDCSRGLRKAIPCPKPIWFK